MASWKFVGLFAIAILVFTKANPLPKKDADNRELNRQEQNPVGFGANGATQRGRQGRQYFGYDYPFAYPSQQAYYPDYFSSDYYNPYRRPNKPRKTNRRQFNNVRQTTQRYSVWDLSKK